MKIVDISWPLHEKMTQYKNRQEVHFQALKTFDVDSARHTRIMLDCHAGTHIESASHFIKDGKTIDAMDLSQCCGRCLVVDMTFVGDCITDEHLQLIHIEPESIILLKTTNSELQSDAPFDSNFVYISSSGADFLAEKKIKAVGLDYLGIERSQETHATHKTLMKNNVAIIEGLRLAHIHAGNYFFVCLPLACISVEAAPARAILFEDL